MTCATDRKKRDNNCWMKWGGRKKKYCCLSMSSSSVAGVYHRVPNIRRARRTRDDGIHGYPIDLGVLTAAVRGDVIFLLVSKFMTAESLHISLGWFNVTDSGCAGWKAAKTHTPGRAWRTNRRWAQRFDFDVKQLSGIFEASDWRSK